MKQKTTITTLSALALVATGGLLVAGPLNPPAGPVTGTYKTLSEVEPRIAINAMNTPGDADSVFRITQPGSYYLTGNVTGVANRRGIEIAANNVTLDLNGFTLQGVPSSLDGIASDLSGLTAITIRNGTIRDWAGDGIDLNANRVVGGQIAHIVAVGNAITGVRAGDAFVIDSCSLVSNTSDGLSVGVGATVKSVIARLNGNNGIRALERAILADCTASNNVGSGFSLTNASAITNSSSDSNGGNGIAAGFLNTISGCTVARNSLGGIITNGSNIIRDNTVSENTNTGIQVAFQSIVRGNTVTLNTGAGIFVTSLRSRIEGNHCMSNATGIQVTGTANLIIGNSCASNSSRNYDIATGNRYGPIINITAAGASAALGNSATSTLLSTDPHANFAH